MCVFQVGPANLAAFFRAVREIEGFGQHTASPTTPTVPGNSDYGSNFPSLANGSDGAAVATPPGQEMQESGVVLDILDWQVTQQTLERVFNHFAATSENSGLEE